jgi:hypothetical protein
MRVFIIHGKWMKFPYRHGKNIFKFFFIFLLKGFDNEMKILFFEVMGKYWGKINWAFETFPHFNDTTENHQFRLEFHFGKSFNFNFRSSLLLSFFLPLCRVIFQAICFMLNTHLIYISIHIYLSHSPSPHVTRFAVEKEFSPYTQIDFRSSVSLSLLLTPTIKSINEAKNFYRSWQLVASKFLLTWQRIFITFLL